LIAQSVPASQAWCLVQKSAIDNIIYFTPQKTDNESISLSQKIVKGFRKIIIGEGLPRQH
jgi:hypothetical protein